MCDGRLGSRLRTKVARWMSFLHCLSSVGSDRAVPKEAKILSKGMFCPRRERQLAMQLGWASPTTKLVRNSVMLWIVMSEMRR